MAAERSPQRDSERLCHPGKSSKLARRLSDSLRIANRPVDTTGE